jgi:hypothetical protein
MHELEPDRPATDRLIAQISAVQPALATERARVEELTKERDHLRASHERLRQELELP